MKFSVVIPTYNRKKLLIKCLKTLEKQTFRDFEVIICDDGSTDGTSSILDEYQFNFQVKYLLIENSGGPARPRNEGVAVSEGNWVCFLDADDLWANDKLELCSQFIEKADIIYHDMNLINEHGKKIGLFKGRKINQIDSLFDLLVYFNPIANSSVCIKRNVYYEIGKFNQSEEVRFVEDFDYWLRSAKSKKIFLYIPTVLGSYLVHTGNSSSDYGKQIKKIKLLYQTYSGMLDLSKRKHALASYNYIEGCFMEKEGNYRAAIQVFKKTMISGHMGIKFKSIYKIIKYYAIKIGR